MKVAIIGARGMLGTDLSAACARNGIEARGYDLPELDISGNDGGLESVSAEIDWLVNCAAYTDVDEAESSRDTAFRVNEEGARRVAEFCGRRGVPLLHISTDYVFDGAGNRPWREDDEPRPLSVYGQSKLAGEAAVRAGHERHVIVRTQSLFGAHGRNFVSAIMSRLESGVVRVVADQTTCPTCTVHLADAILRLLRARRFGTVHVSASGACTWHEFACAIAGAAGSNARIEAVTTDQYPRPARRPVYSVLDKSRYTEWTGHVMPSWREGLAEYMAERRNSTG